VEELSNKHGQLVCILHWSWHLDGSLQKYQLLNFAMSNCMYQSSYTPVVVEMGHLVRELLHFVRVQASVVKDDIVRGRGDCALPHGLRYDEEIVPTKKCFV